MNHEAALSLDEIKSLFKNGLAKALQETAALYSIPNLLDQSR